MQQSPNRPSVLVVGCGALARELLDVVEANDLDNVHVECIPAIFHNTPEKISPAVRERLERSHGYDKVFVAYADRDKALSILAEHLQRFPDTRRQGLRRDFDLLILVAVLGGLLAPIVLIYAGDMAVMLAYLFSAASLAVILGRCQRNYQWYGQYQFSIIELTAGTGLIAISIALWRL